ncbi:LacI family DNA-binding transcriptional regulator [Pseudarthrobacter sp. NS4]|uniref:LacI family DNA-binding transcriptional regulator n=1 Tax=Pseudarthrobacter sp. NS4 TaxID=2973976 RepID=UPI0021635140|nr:substrate-binding domain-containing protein [Pseudarthrobacter sp. NS4]
MVQEAVERGRPKAATIYDVAALAGVSHQTVSRYLKDKSALKPSTLERVEKALLALNYSPNLAARSLRSRELYRVVVVVPEASLYFPARMLNGAAAAAHAAGYRVDVVAMEGTADARGQQLNTLLAAEDIAGILSFVPQPGSATAGQSGTAALVVAGEYDNQMRALGSIADGSPAASIVQHLASLGHRNFFHVAGPPGWPSAHNRRKVYEDTVTALGLNSLGIRAGDWSASSGYEAGLEVAAAKDVTAVVVANDQMAIGVIRALHDHGISVPGQVSVFGWDDTPESKFHIPSLSTVHMDLEALGARSMAELIARMRGGESRAKPLALPPMELLYRESTGPVRS